MKIDGNNSIYDGVALVLVMTMMMNFLTRA